MSYPFFESPNFTPGRKKKIQAIVLHRLDKSLEKIVKWCFNLNSLESYHYLVSRKGKVLQLVKCENTAWHAGWITNPDVPDFFKPNPNFCSIGVLLEGETKKEAEESHWTLEQRESLLELIKFLGENLEIPMDADHVVSHSFIDPERNPNDPGNYLDWDELFRRLSFKKYQAGKTPKREKNANNFLGITVEKIFRGLLNRDPSLSELDYYKYSNLDISQIAKKIIGTDEFRKRIFKRF